MVTIGQPLTAPESGWRRYDDIDSRILNKGFTNGTYSSDYNSTYKQATTSNCTLTFKFYGSNIRLMFATDPGYSNNIKITIDSTINYISSAITTNYQVLLLENNLTLGIHTVIIESTDTLYTIFDCLDIDDIGYLLHPSLNQVSDITTMEVGDCIPCRYTALTGGSVGYFSELGTCIANEIPVAGTTTPNGLFYFIKSRKGLLIADRVIQTNISWDVLNTAKFIEGMPLSLVPPMTSNNQNGYIITSSSVYANSSSYPYFAFDGTIATGTTRYGWGTANGIPYGWIAVEFPIKTIISSYSIGSQYGYVSRAPKSWTFEGSNDDTNWDILDTQTNIIDWKDLIYKTFNINNTTAYKKYKLNVTANNGDTILNIGEIKLLNNLLIRSLTGGVAYIDSNGNAITSNQNLGAWPADNEWDTYIVKSTLNNTITAGDDNIWHWNNGISTRTKDTPITSINTSTYRVHRGTFTTTGSINTFSSNISNNLTSKGFRPVLEYLEPNSKATNLFY